MNIITVNIPIINVIDDIDDEPSSPSPPSPPSPPSFPPPIKILLNITIIKRMAITNHTV